jgi:hypothetical protein
MSKRGSRFSEKERLAILKEGRIEWRKSKLGLDEVYLTQRPGASLDTALKYGVQIGLCPSAARITWVKI